MKIFFPLTFFLCFKEHFLCIKTSKYAQQVEIKVAHLFAKINGKKTRAIKFYTKERDGLSKKQELPQKYRELKHTKQL